MRTHRTPRQHAARVNATSTQALVGHSRRHAPSATPISTGAAPAARADTSVTLNGNTVTASRTFARTFNRRHRAFRSSARFADVTGSSSSRGNGNYTFGGLNVSTGSPHCDRRRSSAAGALIVIYEGAGERLRAINLYDGLDYFCGSQVTQTPDGFRVPAANIDGRIAVFTLEGDPAELRRTHGRLQRSAALQRHACSTTASTSPAAIRHPAVRRHHQHAGQSRPATASTSTSTTSARCSRPARPARRLSTRRARTSCCSWRRSSAPRRIPPWTSRVTKTHTGTFVSGGTGAYTITVSNAAGIEREDNIVTVTDTLPAGLTFNSAHAARAGRCSAVGPGGHLHARADAERGRVVSAAHADRERARSRRGVGDEHRRP